MFNDKGIISNTLLLIQLYTSEIRSLLIFDVEYANMMNNIEFKFVARNVSYQVCKGPAMISRVTK